MANVIAVTLAKYVMRDWVRRNFVATLPGFVEVLDCFTVVCCAMEVFLVTLAGFAVQILEIGAPQTPR